MIRIYLFTFSLFFFYYKSWTLIYAQLSMDSNSSWTVHFQNPFIEFHQYWWEDKFSAFELLRTKVIINIAKREEIAKKSCPRGTVKVVKQTKERTKINLPMTLRIRTPISHCIMFHEVSNLILKFFNISNFFTKPSTKIKPLFFGISLEFQE